MLPSFYCLCLNSAFLTLHDSSSFSHTCFDAVAWDKPQKLPRYSFKNTWCHWELLHNSNSGVKYEGMYSSVSQVFSAVTHRGEAWSRSAWSEAYSDYMRHAPLCVSVATVNWHSSRSSDMAPLPLRFKLTSTTTADWHSAGPPYARLFWVFWVKLRCCFSLLLMRLWPY